MRHNKSSRGSLRRASQAGGRNHLPGDSRAPAARRAGRHPGRNALPPPTGIRKWPVASIRHRVGAPRFGDPLLAAGAGTDNRQRATDNWPPTTATDNRLLFHEVPLQRADRSQHRRRLRRRHIELIQRLHQVLRRCVPLCIDDVEPFGARFMSCPRYSHGPPGALPRESTTCCRSLCFDVSFKPREKLGQRRIGRQSGNEDRP